MTKLTEKDIGRVHIYDPCVRCGGQQCAIVMDAGTKDKPKLLWVDQIHTELKDCFKTLVERITKLEKLVGAKDEPD